MSSPFAELEARQTLQTMTRLRNDIQLFATHARALNAMSKTFDAASLVNEANQLVQKLTAARGEFQGAANKIDTLARSLPSRPQYPGGLSPAAKWVPELRAASKQFEDTVRSAESALGKLYQTGFAGMNSPTRVSTAPDGTFDIILAFSDLLVRWVEHYKKTHK